jgi:hypothetical protein
MNRFIANLSGENEVPPVRTNARGQAVFKLSDDGRRLLFKILLDDIKNVTVAHIHLGPEGVNGPVVVTLFGPLGKAVSIENAVFTGVITSGDLEGPLARRSLSALLREMQRENTYVNVHTVQHPNGEIRGQIFPRD